MARLLIVGIVLFLYRAQALDISPIALREPLPTAATLNAITRFKEHFIAVGENDGRGNVFQSQDARSWSIAECATTNVLRGIATDSTNLVCVGEGGSLFTSTDGTTWTAQNSGVTNDLFAVAYGAGKFVAVGYSFPGLQAVILVSSNLVSWTPTYMTNSFTGVAYGNGTWTVVASSTPSQILVSSNLLDWTPTTVPGETLFSVAHGDSGFVAVGNGYENNAPIAVSPDGISWTRQTVSNSWYLYLGAVCWTGDKYVAAGRIYDAGSYVGSITTSENGTEWTQALKLPGANQLNGIAASGNTMMAVGVHGTIASAAVAADSWTLHGPSTTAPLYSIIYANSKFTAVGDAARPGYSGPGIVRHSTDGITWSQTLLTNGFDPSAYDVVYGNGTYVSVGGRDGGNIQTSTDGTNWTNQSLCCGFRGVTYGDKGFVAVGASWLGGTGIIASSADGSTWTSRVPGHAPNDIFTNFLNAVAYGNGVYIAVGESGTILRSTDTTNWTRNIDVGVALNDVTYIGGAFIAVGDSGRVFTSINGWIWNPTPVGLTNDLYAVAYGNGTLVAVGAGGTVAVAGGVGFNRVPSPTSLSLYDICYANGTFVAVGDRGVILQSRDFRRPELLISRVPEGFDILIPQSEVEREYRLEASLFPTFENPEILQTFSNIYADFTVRDATTNASRFYRVVSP